jgi:DNA-binding response OmpR family regulator
MAHVILIEDDALVRELLSRRMVKAGWNVMALRDGRELENVLAKHPADLLVIDLGLPYIDGFALMESLRANGHTTPVLVISAYELPHLLEAAQSTGANDLLLKPFDQEELIHRMERLIAA